MVLAPDCNALLSLIEFMVEIGFVDKKSVGLGKEGEGGVRI